MLIDNTMVDEKDMMTEVENSESSNSHWFDDLNEYDIKRLKTGQILKGTVIRIDQDIILVDVGHKSDAVVPQRDIGQLPEDFINNLEVGDEVYVVVLRRGTEDKDLIVSLKKGLEYESWDNARVHMENNDTLLLPIVKYNRGGFLVQFESLQGFLPFSQVPEMQSIKSPRRLEQIKKKLLNTSIEVKIIEIVPHRNRLILSARAAEIDKRKQRLAELKRGQILTGKIVNLTSFGAFVDLGDIDGLIHISQLDWRPVKNPSDVLRVGDEIEVKIIGVDIEKERVSLSRKAVLPSPWETVDEEYQAGDFVEGRVTRIVDFGAFVKLPNGIEGLMHTSQIGYSPSQNPRNAIKQGETVLVRILSIEPERKRIALSMRQVPLERQIAWTMEQTALIEAENLDEDKKSEEPVSAKDTDAPTSDDTKTSSVEGEDQEITVEDLIQDYSPADEGDESNSRDSSVSQTDEEGSGEIPEEVLSEDEPDNEETQVTPPSEPEDEQ